MHVCMRVHIWLCIHVYMIVREYKDYGCLVSYFVMYIHVYSTPEAAILVAALGYIRISLLCYSQKSEYLLTNVYSTLPYKIVRKWI